MREALSALVAIAACASTTLLLHLPATSAYRIKGKDENKPFVPYEEGFVQNVQDPASTANRTRVNHGYARSVLLGDGVGKNRLFSCPQMVGPIDEPDGEKHYCRGKEYGYCDRRSGTCFCNDGYTGDSCESCAPTHFEVGGLCYAKRVCPNDCSHAGRCNYLTGVCECSDHREGDDCSKSKCSRFHRFCTHCNDDGCIECEEGFSVHKDTQHGYQCEPCWRFDPRCRDCNADVCTSCIDLLLLSIHRSGRRPQDPPLPVDELMRELSVTVPFGSQQNDAFYDAEHYFMVEPSLVPLNESDVECHQGLNLDDSITCVPYNLTSNIMCGNHGTITFESPEYAVREDGKQIRLTLRRSGGGVGEVAVSYSIYPITAGYEDVTSTAYYTANQTVVFRPGQIRASFLVSINDDRIMEANETFSVHLSNPTGGSRLGTQSRTIVTIIDDDEHKTCSEKTTLGHDKRDLGSVEAGTHFHLNIFAKTCAGNDQTIGGDVVKVEARKVGAKHAPITKGRCNDLDDGTYACDVNATVSANYILDVYQLVPGGLKGYYYTDNYLTDERLDIIRTDAVVNFTWGTGAVTTFGRDFVSVRWEGYVMPSFSDTYTFWLDVDDHVRLWIDGILLIDSWTFSPTSGMLHAAHDLTALETHELVMEYREILGNSTARLLWSSANTPLTAIPSSSLFYKEAIERNPFYLQVLPTSPSAIDTVAFGKGLYQGIAGKVHSFTITPKDRFGNFRGWPLRDVIPGDTRHLDQFQATAELIDDDGGGGLGNSLIPVIISYNDNTRKYDATWNPRRSGMYQLNVVLIGPTSENHIFGSPFIVKTIPGATFAPESVTFGGYGHCLPWASVPCPGIRNGMAGMNSTFTIQAYDLNRNTRDVGGDDWKVIVSSSLNSSDYHVGSIEDHGDGSYTASVAPLISSQNDLHISLDGSPIKGSPFRMDVVHGQVVGSSSYVVDEADASSMIAMTENTLLVQATDEWGNVALYSNEHSFYASVSVESKDIDESKTRINYVGGGKYAITVVPETSGPIILSIKLNDFDIRDSAFNVTVLPGTFSASSSSARGDGLKRATAGSEAHFVIQTKDKGGNIKNEDDALFSVDLMLFERSVAPVSLDVSGDEIAVVSGITEFMDDGQYMVKYTCYQSGEYVMHVGDSEGEDITGSPFRLTVAPSTMSAPHSLVVGGGLSNGVAGEVAEIRVYGMDKYGNFVKYAVETLEMTMSLSSRHQSDWEVNEINNHEIKQLARDGGSGIFILDYTPTFSGEYELGLTTFSPGGLDASYYATPDLSPDYLISTSVDKSVEKFWEDDTISKMVGTQSHLGAGWNGKLAADHDEEYTITVECNDGGYASLGIDGKTVPWQSCHPKLTTTIDMRANKAVDFSLRYKSLEGNAFAVLRWASPTVDFETIPSRNLFHQETVGNDTLHHPVISPGAQYPPQTVALGDPLTNAISGIEHEFVVEIRDNGGNLLLDGGQHNVQVDSFHYQDESTILKTNIFDNDNGTLAIKYNPRSSGYYFVSVTLGGSDIKGTPFMLLVEPGETDPEESVLLVEGTIEGVAGRALLIELQARDTNQNKRHRGGDEILAEMIPVSVEDPEDTLHCKAEYTSDGLYSLACPPASQARSYLLHVDILTRSGNTSIKSSPFPVTIYPGHAIAVTTEVASSKKNEFNGKAGVFETFEVTAKDKFGNALSSGGNRFVGRVRGDTSMDDSEKRIEVIDQGNGNYVFAYRLSHPSTYKIDVSLVTGTGLAGEYYKNETSFKEGTPDSLLVDDQINFNTRSLGDDSLFSYFRRMAWISFPHTSIFDLELTGIEGSCKLWLGDELVLDTDIESAVGSFRATENVLYEIKIETRTHINRLMLQLFWSTRKMRRQIIPKQHFFSSAEPIRGSPFHLTVTQ